MLSNDKPSQYKYNTEENCISKSDKYSISKLCTNGKLSNTHWYFSYLVHYDFFYYIHDLLHSSGSHNRTQPLFIIFNAASIVFVNHYYLVILYLYLLQNIISHSTSQIVKHFLQLMLYCKLKYARKAFIHCKRDRLRVQQSLFTFDNKLI